MYPILYCCTTCYTREIICTCRVLMPLLLLRRTGVAAAAVGHRVPDGKIVPGSWNLIPPSMLFLCIQAPKCLLLIHVPFGSAVTLTVSICLYYILGNYGTRGAKAGISPPWRSPRCMQCCCFSVPSLSLYSPFFFSTSYE